MKDTLFKIKTNLKDKLPAKISKLIDESIELSEWGNYTESLRTLSGCLFIFLLEEYYTPAGLVYEDSMGVVEILRELRNKGKDIGKSETDAILRINEKAKLEEVDAIVLETCFEGAVTVFESYIREKGNKLQKKVETTGRKSPGPYILEEMEDLFLESNSDRKLREYFPKIEEIYRDFPYDKEIKKMYFQFVSLVDVDRAKKEILGYLESGDVTIHLGAVCITLLAEMGLMYDAKKMLGWYEGEFSGERDGLYAKLSVFLHAYLKDGRLADKQRAESAADIMGQNKEPYYEYIENCYHLFSDRKDAIQKKSEGLYLYKESIFWGKCQKRSEDDLAEKELIKQEEEKEREFKKFESTKVVKVLKEEKEKEIKNSKVIIEPIKKEVVQKKEEPIQIQERKIESTNIQTLHYGQFEKTYTNSIGMEFVLIPAGEFMMGAVPQDKEAKEDEKPQHKVQITKPFYIGKYPVTQEEWEKVMGSNPSEFKHTTEGLIFKKIIKINTNYPVESVSWNDCQEFIKKLTQREGNKYRLPTEAEWEYSARGVEMMGMDGNHLQSKDIPSQTTPAETNLLRSPTIYLSGNDDYKLGAYAWYDIDPENTTHRVGKKKPNVWGLYDIIGNVWEWCEDWYAKDYYKNSPSVDPLGPSSGSYRVVRGSSWDNNRVNSRTSNRDLSSPTLSGNSIGFRLAWTPIRL